MNHFGIAFGSFINPKLRFGIALEYVSTKLNYESESLAYPTDSNSSFEASIKHILINSSSGAGRIILGFQKQQRKDLIFGLSIKSPGFVLNSSSSLNKTDIFQDNLTTGQALKTIGLNGEFSLTSPAEIYLGIAKKFKDSQIEISLKNSFSLGNESVFEGKVDQRGQIRNGASSIENESSTFDLNQTVSLSNTVNLSVGYSAFAADNFIFHLGGFTDFSATKANKSTRDIPMVEKDQYGLNFGLSYFLKNIQLTGGLNFTKSLNSTSKLTSGKGNLIDVDHRSSGLGFTLGTEINL